MAATEKNVSGAVQAFQAAALGAGSWSEALSKLAEATGSRSGQLMGMGADAAIPFNWVTNVPLEGLEEFVAINGGDPHVNPRVRAGLNAQPLEVLTEADFATPEALRMPIYTDFFARYDLPHICLTNLHRDGGIMLGLSVLRSRKEGEISADQRRAFSLIAPHVQAAVRTQISLRAHGAGLIAGAMEALGSAVFVCDGQGRVSAMSAQAEELARSGRHLRLVESRLAAWAAADTRALDVALHQTCSGALAMRAPTLLLAPDRDGADPLLIEVAAIPAERHGLGFGACALVVVRAPRLRDGRAAALARALFGLTQAETAVVADLVAGLSPDAIASRAGVSINTVRTHIKRTYDKAGVRSQLELVSLITARM
jgi:DNA-binding CsgD family transcriptional regulator